MIELIYTIVILSAAVIIVPRIFYLSNKSIEFSRKEDAIFNLMAEAIDISVKEYDENNTKYDDILLVNNPPKNILDCNVSSGYRVGGFVGSRNCFNGIFESEIGPDSGEPPYDDIDDYNDTLYNINNKYFLKIRVSYAKEWNDYDNEVLIFKFSDGNGSFSNIKRVYIYLYDNDKNISSVSYYSANIGHSEIKSIVWK